MLEAHKLLARETRLTLFRLPMNRVITFSITIARIVTNPCKFNSYLLCWQACNCSSDKTPENWL